jgi:aspartyl-tRNA(Asn)/glutamyl-tRNA(Gln) amidotransferase subunit A
MLGALVPGLEPAAVDLGSARAAVAWVEDADPGVRARVERAAELFGRSRLVDFPLMPANIDAAFQREVADVHRDLFAAHAELYGANVRRKVERALQVTDEDYEASAAARDRYRGEASDVLEGFDLLVVPTIGSVAPPRAIPEPDLRRPVLRFTEPFNVLGWPALALPCGAAESGLPASLTLAGRWEEDDRVLGAALALEAALGLP